MNMVFFEKFKKIRDKNTIKTFLLGEKANDLGKKAAKLDKKQNKTPEEAAAARELRKEAEQLRAQQLGSQQLGQQMGMGEKILRAYFAYKIASLACRTLVGMSGGYYDRDRAIGAAVTNGIDKLSDRLADSIENSPAQEGEDINQHRAEMIEETLESFQKMSEAAAAQGITNEGEPLLNEHDKDTIQDLATASRENDIEQYTAKCQDLGLDATEARAAFEQDRTIDNVQNDGIEKEKAEIDKSTPTDPGYGMEI